MATSNPIPARRGSLVGPLILLLLGLLFLASNLRPELSVWRLFAQYWPFLLIFWGVARLIEYAVARSGWGGMPRPVTGGEVFLAVLLCIAGHSLFVAERGDWGFMRWGHRGLEVLGQSYDFPLDASRPAPANPEIIIENPQGSVHVAGGDVQEINVTGQKSIQAFDRAAAEDADRHSPLEITGNGNQIHIRTGLDRRGSRRVLSNLEITVPKNAAVRIEGRGGDLNVKDVSGAVDLKGGSATVTLSNIGGSVRVDVQRSDLIRGQQLKGLVQIDGRGRDIDLQEVAGTVEINGDFSGNVHLSNLAKPARYTSSVTTMRIERLPGSLEMDLGTLHATGVTGPFKLEARSKDVRLEGFSQDVDISTRRGDVDMRDPRLPLSSIRAETQNGDINLALPENAVFSIQASTAHGTVESGFGEHIRIEQNGRSSQMRGGTGPAGAGAQIRLSSSRGTINLSKATYLQRQ